MSQFVNFNWTCSHFNTVDDFSNGCEVCTDCGLVMHEQIYAQYSNQVETLKMEKKWRARLPQQRQFCRGDNAEGV